MPANPPSKAAPVNAVAQVSQLLEKAQQFAGWIGAALEHRAQFPARVVLAVVQDYLGQYENLSPQLRGAAQHASQERKRLADQVVELEATVREVEGRVDELRLRLIIGEFTKEEFQRREAEARGRLDAAALPAARSAMEQIDEVLAAVGGVQARIAEYSRQLVPAEVREVPVPPPAPEVPEAHAPAPPSNAPAIYHSNVTVPAAPAVPASAVAPPAPSDELGEEAYRAGGGMEDEWDVGQAGGAAAAARAHQEQDTPPGGWGAEAAGPGSMDLGATGLIATRSDAGTTANAALTAASPVVPAPLPPAASVVVPGEGPRLLVFAPEAPEQLYPFGGEVMSLGRGRNNDIQIKNDGKISRYHCRIFRRGDEFIIEDNKSSNGTMVDGKLVTRQRLDGGEQVQIGETRVIFQL